MDDNMVGFLGFLGLPLGYAMRWIYMLVQNYGWTIIIFTFIVRILMFPLSLKQQKSQARMAAFQPMIQEIQKKWANDKTRQNQEVMKFQEENGVSMTDGCLPMLVNMLVLFGIIAVIQAPMNYILKIPAEQISNGVAIVEYYEPESSISKNTYTKESILIGEITEMPERFIEGFTSEEEVTNEDGSTETVIKEIKMDEEYVEAVKDFKFNFMGLNLSVVPTLGFNVYLILPILSVLTQFASQFIIMKTGGQAAQAGRSMWTMTIVMGLFFGWFAFTVPVGFSLYYTASNLVMTLQQLVLKRIYDPEKIKQQIIVEVEERKKAKKSKKQVKVQDEEGKVVTKELSEAEIAKLRLAKARELDAQKYNAEAEEAAALPEKAQQQDEQKYGEEAADKEKK
ncbi:MAG: YidC/Oxa1 family membrane protein insertase [Oscillospiraceae bacterium]